MCTRKSPFRKPSFKPGFVILLVVFIGGCAELRDMPFGINMEEILRRLHQVPSSNSCRVTEVLRAPFSSGVNSITTLEVYSGPLLLTVMGTGQASATAYSDAFYVFTDYEGVSISPQHQEDWILSINDQAADVYIPDGQIPAYNADHRYIFEINAPGGALTFGVRDDYIVDNSGGYLITICRYSREGVSIAEADMATQSAMVAAFPATPTPSPMPQVTSTPLSRPTTTPAFSVGNPVTLESIHMLSNTQGWGTSGNSVLITRDGALTWRELQLPAAPEKYSEEFGSTVYFEAIDTEHAWLLYAPKPFAAIHGCVAHDAPVWYTSDSGQTWNTSRPLMHALGDMNCRATFIRMDTQQGWLSIDGWYVAAGPHKETQLFRTMDGGSTWKPVEATWCYSEREDSCSSNTPRWLSDKAIHGRTGWMLKNLSECGPCYGNVPTPDYFVSTDGGDTWKRHDLPSPTGTSDFYERYFFCEPYDLNLLSEQVVRLKLSCSQYELDAKPEAVDHVYASEDGGITWQTFKLPVSSAELATRLKFFDPDHGLLLGTTMWKTSNGGETWQEVNSVTWDGQFSFVDRDHGWAIARSGVETALVYSADGGASWQILEPLIGSGE